MIKLFQKIGIKVPRLGSIFVILFILNSNSNEAYSSNYVEEPETELALIKASLDQWLLKLNAEEKLNHEYGIGPQNDAAERAWINSNEFFGRKEWTSAIRELNNFLNQLQVPDGERFLKSQYMLGIAYEELQYREKSVKAYFRYIAATLTSKQERYEELLDVLRRLVPLASTVATKKELRQQLAALTSLDLPKSIRHLVYYYAGKAAIGVGDFMIADEWLREVAAIEDDEVLKSRATYLSGVIAIQSKKTDLAEEYFSKAIASKGDEETRDLARLALARLAFKQRKSAVAIRYYDAISSEAPAFKDATFESIYALMDTKNEAEARVKALLYLSRWPEGSEAMQVRILLPYLDMKVGDLTAAKASIGEADRRLQDIKKWLQVNLATQSSITQTILDDLKTLTGPQLPVPATVERATQLYVRLAELSRRLYDIRGSVRNTLFTVGRARIENLRPFWIKRASQLNIAAEELLKIGHRLIETERRLYANRLSPVDRQRLEASFARRSSLLSVPAISHRKARNWDDFTTTSALTARVAGLNAKVSQIKSQLAAAKYSCLLSTKGDGQGEELVKIEEQIQKMEKLQEFTLRSLEAIRRYRVNEIAEESPHIATYMLFQGYASALIDEELVLSRPRSIAKSSHERLNAEDANAAWAQWRILASMLVDQLANLDHEMRKKLGGLVEDLDSQENGFELSDAKILTLNRMLSDQLGQSLNSIVDQYNSAIDERFARHQKMRGDIDYLSYLNKREDREKLQDQYNLEQQILRDNLLGLQQGALWQWPN